MWHDNAKTRKEIGDELEQQFEKQVRCHCGGRFSFIGDRYKGCPDFTCESCGQLADVKTSPQAIKTGNIAVSARPWAGYPDEMLLVTNIDGKWIGQYKRFIVVKNSRPFESTHRTQATSFHLIAWSQFRSLRTLGYKFSKAG
jgi:hypothetical protein